MKEKKVQLTEKGKSNDASTLAASSLAQFFKEKKWKIVSFFPNCPCGQGQCPNRKAPSCKKCQQDPLENTHK